MLLVTFFALLYLFYLSGNLLIFSLFINILNLLFKDVQFISKLACGFFLSLLQLNFSNGILNLLITLFQEFFGLFFGFSKNVFTTLIEFGYLFFILLNNLFDIFLTLMYRLSFIFPIAFVTNYILKIFITLDIIRANEFRCLLNNTFRNTSFTSNLDSERASWLSYR